MMLPLSLLELIPGRTWLLAFAIVAGFMCLLSLGSCAKCVRSEPYACRQCVKQQFIGKIFICTQYAPATCYQCVEYEK